MNQMRVADCTSCPSEAECGASEFRPVAAAFRQLRDFILTSGPAGGANCLTGDTSSDRALRKAAAKLADARRNRARSLPGELLGEPAWDILLELFSQPAAQSMKSLCIGAGVPLTTTLRWVALLEQQGMLDQFPDPGDARRTLVRLTADGQAKVADAVSGIRAAMRDGGDQI